MNYCYKDVINNRQKDYLNVKYELSNIFAVMDIGKERKMQQDGVLFLQHPSNNNIKLIAIADGMGGLEDGAIASNLSLLKLSKWFLNEFSNYDNLNQLKNRIYNLINITDLYIRNMCDGGTTISFAIVLEYYTIFVNIGDSRIYIKNAENFYQISEDHSIVWDLFKSGNIKEKDDIRFHKNNNLILSRLGGNPKLLKIDYKILSNKEYDNVFLFTDGITDCLSDLQLLNIINNDKQNNCLLDIIRSANNVMSYNSTLLTDDYYDRIVGGKENRSAIVLKNELKW